MKRTLALLGSIAMLGASQLTARQFEGVVTQRSITVDKYALEQRGFDTPEAIFDASLESILELRDELEGSGEMTVVETNMYIKGTQMRVDMETDEGPSYLTMDLGQGIMRMVQPSQGMYIEMTKEDMERMKAMSGGGPQGGDTQKPQATGQSRAINGMQTVAYDMATDDGTRRMWVSKDNADLVSAYAALMERVSAMSMGEDGAGDAELIAEYGYPVLTQSLGYDEYELEELVSVEAQSVADDLFAPPAGLKKMTMADLMGR